MNLLYAPWRDSYTKKVKDKDGVHKEGECVFCQLGRGDSADDDKESLVLGRYRHHYVVMNKYPYNAGHLLVVPFKHCAQLSDLLPEAIVEHMILVAKVVELLTESLKCEGINMGMNIGRIAGAGIPDHIHMHIVPRWGGDTNFLPIVCDTKQISVDMVSLYTRLKEAFKKLVME